MFRYQDEAEKQQRYRVVINEEEQYSLWPDGREIPFGWKAVGEVGDRETCLSYIQEVWTDMRPKSLRLQMEAAGL